MKNALANLIAEVKEAENNSAEWKKIARQKMGDCRALTRIIKKSEPDFTLDAFMKQQREEEAAPEIPDNAEDINA